MNRHVTRFEPPFVVFLGDITQEIYGKTGLGLVQWRPEHCVGQLRLPGCGVDAGVPDLDVAAAVAAVVLGKTSCGSPLSGSTLLSYERCSG